MGVNVKPVTLSNVEDALKTPFIFDSSKRLIRAAWSGKLEEFSKRLMEYHWFGTRDYTMALIIFSIVVAASKDEELEKFLKSGISGTQFAMLCARISAGDGKRLQTFFESSKGGWFRDIFMDLATKSGKGRISVIRVWQGFLAQVAKMKPWKKNREYIENNLIGAIASAFGEQYRGQMIAAFPSLQVDLPDHPAPQLPQAEPPHSSAPRYEPVKMKLNTLPPVVKCEEDFRKVDKNAKDVVINEGVTSIPLAAFMRAYVENVTIPGTVKKIEKNAFKASHIKHITIPEGVESIEDYAFKECLDLETVVMANSVKKIGKFAFNFCPKLSKINISKGVKEIGWSTFDSCKSLSKITIPDSVETIGEDAFAGCPPNMQILGDPKPKVRAEIEKQIGRVPKVDPIASTTTTTTTTTTTADTLPHSQVKHANDSQVKRGENTKSQNSSVITINSVEDFDRVNVMGMACSNVTSITVSGKVKEIPFSFFAYGFSALKNVKIEDGLDSIGANAFRNCQKLSSVIIPKSVKSIGTGAFEGCKSLSSIAIPDEVESIADKTFAKCTGLLTITIPGHVKTIGKNAFNGCGSLAYVKMPNSVETIGEDAFAGCPSNMQIFGNPKPKVRAEIDKQIGRAPKVKPVATTEPTTTTTTTGNSSHSQAKHANDSQVKRDENTKTENRSVITINSVEDFAKVKNSDESIEEVLISGNIRKIPAQAFVNCENLSRVTISGNVNTIGELAFARCLNLKAVTIKNGVKSIAEYAFAVCPILSSIKIPESVSSVGEGAFDRCHKLTDVTIESDNTKIGDSAFSNCGSIQTVHVPNTGKGNQIMDEILRQAKGE